MRTCAQLFLLRYENGDFRTVNERLLERSQTGKGIKTDKQVGGKGLRQEGEREQRKSSERRGWHRKGHEGRNEGEMEIRKRGMENETARWRERSKE